MNAGVTKNRSAVPGVVRGRPRRRARGVILNADDSRRASVVRVGRGAAGPRQDARAAPDAVECRTGGRRVLVADDERVMRLLLRVNLSLSGFEVVEAENGAGALELAREQPLDLILLDVMMPGLSGFEVAEQLRRDPQTANVPIVFLSARADEADVRRGIELDAIDYITKPFDPLSIGSHLNGLLEGAREPHASGHERLDEETP